MLDSLYSDRPIAISPALAATIGLEDAVMVHVLAELLTFRPIEAGLRPDVSDVDLLAYEARRDAAWRDWLAEKMSGAHPALRDFLDLGFGAADLEKIRDALLELPELRASFPCSAWVSCEEEAHTSIRRNFMEWESFAQAHCVDDTDKARLEVEELRDWFDTLADLSRTQMLRALWQPSRKLNKRVGSAAKWGETKEEGGKILKDFRGMYDSMLGRAAAILGQGILAEVTALVAGFAESFENETREAGLLSYSDMLFLATRLVRESPAARTRIRRGIQHFLVDEFQDTDPLQVELIFLLAGEEDDALDWRKTPLEGANLFLVGDPKQSIYRFRRADIAIYHEVKERIERLESGRVLYIRENFRSGAGVLDFVNAVFSRAIVPEPEMQPAYVALETGSKTRGGGTFLIEERKNEGGEEGDVPKPTAEERRAHEAALLAASIRELVNVRRVEIREGGARRPARYGDVAVLFRTRTGYSAFEAAFRSANIPFVSDGGRGFYEKFEVGADVSVLLAVLRPADPLALAAALRSPLYGFSDEDIARYFLEIADVPADMVEAVREIHLLHEKRKDVSPRALLEEIYRRTGAFELFLASSEGEQRVANLWKLLDMAFEFAGDGKRGADDFAAHVEAHYALGREAKEPEAVLSTDKAEAVRFMTIHQAKGLEFPVVAMADLEGRDSSGSTLWVADRTKETVDLGVGPKGRRLVSMGYEDALAREKKFEKAENVRLWYVAATRTRDWLLWPKASLGSFLEKAGVNAQEGEAIARMASPLAVERGVFEPAPPILRVRDAAFHASDAGSMSAPGDREELEAKLARLKKPAPSRAFLAPSSLVEKGVFDDAGPEAAADGIPPGSADVHAGGTAFGRLVHSILARLEPPSVARLEILRAESLAHARALALDEEDAAHAISLIRRSLEGGVLRRAAAATRRLRELPFMFEVEGRAVRGFVDLVWEEKGALTIVDFKTDRVTAEGAPRRAELYANQGGAYAMGLEAATGLAVRELVFAFLRPGVDVPLPVDDLLRRNVRAAAAR